MSLGKRLFDSSIGCTTNTLNIFGDGSCIAAYTFDGNVNDLGGNYNGTANSITYTTGQYGQAASFNGSSSYVSLSNASTMLGTPSGQTISFWANHNTVPSSGYSGMTLLAANNGVSPNWQITLYNAKLACDYFQSGSIYRQRASQTTTISANTWYHFVVTFDSSDANITQLYVNGQLETTTNTTSGGTYSGGINNPSFPITIGYRPAYGNTWYMDGEIDQVRIFNKELSQTEITTLYNEIAC